MILNAAQMRYVFGDFKLRCAQVLWPMRRKRTDCEPTCSAGRNRDGRLKRGQCLGAEGVRVSPERNSKQDEPAIAGAHWKGVNSALAASSDGADASAAHFDQGCREECRQNNERRVRRDQECKAGDNQQRRSGEEGKNPGGQMTQRANRIVEIVDPEQQEFHAKPRHINVRERLYARDS